MQATNMQATKRKSEQQDAACASAISEEELLYGKKSMSLEFPFRLVVNYIENTKVKAMEWEYSADQYSTEESVDALISILKDSLPKDLKKELRRDAVLTQIGFVCYATDPSKKDSDKDARQESEYCNHLVETQTHKIRTVQDANFGQKKIYQKKTSSQWEDHMEYFHPIDEIWKDDEPYDHECDGYKLFKPVMHMMHATCSKFVQDHQKLATDECVVVS